MKTHLFFSSIIFLFACFHATAQTINVDFETGATGANWNWVVDANGDDPPLEIIANEVSGGINTTPTVAKFTARTAGQTFALTFTDNIAPFQFDATNSTITIMVNKPIVSNVAIKLEATGGNPFAEILIPNSSINQWEEITYDFSALIGNGVTYTRLVVIPDFAGRAQDNVIYFDNIISSGAPQPPATAPTTAAPAPVHDEVANQVISIFSDSYTNVPGTNLNPRWGQPGGVSIVTQELIEGNNTLKYANLTYQGTQFGSSQDVSGLDVLHVDFWSADITSLRFFVITEGQSEIGYSLSITPNQWNSAEIPLSYFPANSNVNLTNVSQFKVDQGGNGTVWFDNFYFYNSSALPVELLSFSGKADEGQTHLTWETATETNNDYFQIEKSLDGRSFSRLAQVDGAGNSSSTQSYEAWDKAPATGINYYRLKQVDFDGTSSYSNVITVKFESDKTLTLVNRRVVDQNIQLTYEVAREGKYRLTIVDVTGRVLHNLEMNLTAGLNEIVFDTPVTGILMAVLSNGNERSVDKIFK